METVEVSIEIEIGDCESGKRIIFDLPSNCNIRNLNTAFGF